SLSGKCRPISPSPAAPRIASARAWHTTSASECPARPGVSRISTPPKRSTLPTCVGWTSNPRPTLTSGTSSDTGHGGVIEKEALGPGQVVGGGDLEIDGLAGHHADAVPGPLEQRGVVGPHHARL